MAYSTATFQAASIILYIHFKTEEENYDYLSTKRIAEMLNIPAPTVVKIISKLNSAGLIQTKEGAKGGVLLAKPTENITLLDIFLAIEHGALFKVEVDYLVEHPQVDHVKSIITDSLQDAEKAMKDSLKQKTLADIAIRSEGS